MMSRQTRKHSHTHVKVLTIDDIDRVYQDIQATSHGDQKLNLLEFDGELNRDIFMDWLIQVESLFEYKYKRPEQVQPIETKLRKGAIHRWRSVKTTIVGARKSCITKWCDMKIGLQKRFFMTTYGQDLSERILSFTQGSLNMAECLDKFCILSRRAKVDKPEYITVERYKRGFSKPIRNIICLSTIYTIADALEAATQAEAIIATIVHLHCTYSLKTKKTSTTRTPTTVAAIARQARSRTPFTGQCFNYHQYGHRIPKCQNKVTSCAMTKCWQYLAVVLDPVYDYGEEFYEMHTPSEDSRSCDDDRRN